MPSSSEVDIHSPSTGEGSQPSHGARALKVYGIDGHHDHRTRKFSADAESFEIEKAHCMALGNSLASCLSPVPREFGNIAGKGRLRYESPAWFALSAAVNGVGMSRR